MQETLEIDILTFSKLSLFMTKNRHFLRFRLFSIGDPSNVTTDETEFLQIDRQNKIRGTVFLRRSAKTREYAAKKIAVSMLTPGG